MQRIFREKGITEADIISFKDMKMFFDEKSVEFVPEKLDKIVAKAEKQLEKDIPLLPLSVYLDFKNNGNRSRYENIYFQRRVMAFDLGLAEAYERKGRFLSKLADVVWAIMEESTWIIPAHIVKNNPTHGEYGVPPVFGNDRLHGIDLFSAGTAGLLTFVYSYLRQDLDSISPVIAEKLSYMLKDRIIKPYLNCQFWWTGEAKNPINNWCPWIISNILYTMANVEEDDYVRGRIVKRALENLDNFISEYKPDGGCTEGPSYWGAAGASYFDCLELLYDISGGKIDVYNTPLIKSVFEYIVKFHISGKRFINFADCPPTCHHDGIMIRRMGEKCASEMLCAFGDTMATIDDLKYNISHVYRALRNLIRPTPKICEGKALAKAWLPDLKVMVSRASTNPSEGIFLAMKGGTNGEQHNHNDVGNFVVYYEGNPVIIDTGAGAYTKKTFSAQRYELWFMQSNYHNLPAFGTVAEKDGVRYCSTDEEYDAESGRVKMQLKNAYPENAGLISYTREAYLDSDKVIHITDAFDMNEAQEVDFRFMTCAKPILEKEGVLRIAEGRTMTYDKALKCEIEEFEVNDPGIERNWKTTVLWRIHLSTFAKNGSFEITIK